MRYVLVPADVHIDGLINQQTQTPIPAFDLSFKAFFLQTVLTDPQWLADEAGPALVLSIAEKIELISGPGDVLALTDGEQERASKIMRAPTKPYLEPLSVKLMRFVAPVCGASTTEPPKAAPAPSQATFAAPATA